MRDPARIPRILAKLGRLWSAATENALVDMLHDVLDLSDCPDDSEVHAVGDDILERRLDDLLAAGWDDADAGPSHLGRAMVSGLVELVDALEGGPIDGLTLRYRGYAGVIERDNATGSIHGRVALARDVVTFRGATFAEAFRAFGDSVDDYLAHCAARGDAPESPAPADPDVAAARAALAEADAHGTVPWDEIKRGRDPDAPRP